MVNVLLLATDSFLLQRTLPDDYKSTKKYDGIFHCRFCKFGIWEDVYIDDRLPVGDDGLIYGSSSNEYTEMWIPLLEKAYAKFGGTYEAIRTRRFLEDFRTLTGGTGVEIKLSDRKFYPDYIGNKIDLALQQGSWVVCSVSESSDGDLNLIYGQVFIIKAILKVETKRGKEVILVRMRNPIGNNEWTGPWSQSSSEWETVVCNQRPFMLDREFFMSVDSLIKYMNCITICNLIPEQDKLGTEERSNYTTKIYSEWKGNMAAGLDYLKNPKYLIKISDKGIEDDGKVRVVIILEQMTHQTSTELVALRTKLYKVHTECKHGMIIEDITEEGICSKRISVTLSVRVVPGNYLIVPHTDREEYEKDFMIAIFTPTPLKGVRFIDGRNPILVSRQGTTVKLKGATSESKLECVNYSWGEWDLQQGYLHGEDFEKNPQFEIQIPYEAPSCVVRFQLLKDSFQEDACIGFRLFKMTSYRKMPLTKSWIDAIWDDPVKCHDGSIEGWHWDYIAPTYTLAPGTYIAIAWADKPDYKCSFCLVVKVSFPIKVTCYNDGNST
ncbi:calpain-1 catalytic subunit-like [Mytilus californianus]|uniref:calpain-1 catalytic subunit-like n=1 Tax=Mytilus californianus TaxID=6549 RepID=UPI0022465D1C|nr:calpain-1 catalytic subunit-like [Mytilus californianus]